MAASRGRRFGVAVLGLALLGAGAWAFDQWRAARALAAARVAISGSKLEEARATLTRLTSRWPDWAEAQYRLGLVQADLGDPAGAVTAWAKVPPGTPWSDAAQVDRARVLLQDLGQYATAETLLTEVLGRLRPSDPLALDARQALERLLRFQGRNAEVRALLREGWASSPDPVQGLRGLWTLDADAFPVDGVRDVLAREAALAPEDPRVELGLAMLAIRTGRLDEADRRLSGLEAKAASDPAVARARLEWARAADRPDVVAAAARVLPARVVAPDDRWRLASWLSRRADDPQGEREALTNLERDDPGQALERLADLAGREGRTDEARSFRERKARVDVAKERYRALLESTPPADAYPELGSLAEIQGRRFEARGWWTLVLRRAPGDPAARAALARLGRDGDDLKTSSTMLADLLPDLEKPWSRPTEDQPEGPGPPRIEFEEVAQRSGLSFAFDPGTSPERQLPETMSGGIGLIDYDGDGHLDVFGIRGGRFPPPPEAPFGDRLFRNRGDGTFEDVTERSGLARFPGGFGHGMAVGDIDNDGHADLFLTRWRSYALYRNRGDGTFEDVTASWGLSGDRDWPTSAAFADLDNDGDLDLYVCHYVIWDEANPSVCLRKEGGDDRQYCDPRKFPSIPDHLFRNDGGRFVDISDEAGITAADIDGRGLGVLAADLDEDGKVDIYVANDTTANFLFRNLGGMKFEEIGDTAGVAGNADGGYQAGMGIAHGDLDGDGRADLLVTNFFGEGTTGYMNLGGGLFADRSADLGLVASTRSVLGFGLEMGDIDNDGRPDLVQANGHINDYAPYVPFLMSAQMFQGTARGRLDDISPRLDATWTRPRLGRGLVVSDLDGDGRLDVLMVDARGPTALFRNRVEPAGRWVELRLEGRASNRDGVGAVVTAKAGSRTWVLERVGGGSIFSARGPWLHLGLGAVEEIDQLEVRWPSGRVDRHLKVATQAAYQVREGGPGLTRLPTRNP
jgi:tetratricopeptide (TPR) repeat protein